MPSTVAPPGTPRWAPAAITLHWLTAVLVLGMIGLGLYMARLPVGPRAFELYQLHKSLGLTVLGLTLIRLAVRARRPAPPLPDTLKRWERWAARATHLALYGFLLALPLVGWLMASASPWGIPTVYFGLFQVPHPLGPNAELEALLKTVHAGLSYGLAALLVLHIAAALKHHWLLRDDVLVRMLPHRPAAFLHSSGDRS